MIKSDACQCGLGPTLERPIGTNPSATTAGDAGSSANVGSPLTNFGSATSECASLAVVLPLGEVLVELLRVGEVEQLQPRRRAVEEVDVRVEAEARSPPAHVDLTKEVFAPFGAYTMLRSNKNEEHLPWSQPGWQQ